LSNRFYVLRKASLVNPEKPFSFYGIPAVFTKKALNDLNTSTFLAHIGKTILFQVNVNNIPKITIVYVSLG